MKSRIDELGAIDFQREWAGCYRKIFSDRDIINNPFVNDDWRCLLFGAPAYFLDFPVPSLSDDQVNHLRIYVALQATIESRGGREIVGSLQGGPHRNPSCFRAKSTSGSTIRDMREAAVDGFDLHVFSKSMEWGLVVSWQEEVALLGGNSCFMDEFFSNVEVEQIKKEDGRIGRFMEGISDDVSGWLSRLRQSRGIINL